MNPSRLFLPLALLLLLTPTSPTAALTELSKLNPTSLPSGSEFGTSVSISDSTAVAGAPLDSTAPGGGSAFVFERAGDGSWSQARKLEASDGESGDFFGFSVDIDGDILAVGAPLVEEGAGIDRGAVYVFIRDEGGAGMWGEVAKLVANDPQDDDRFGAAVAVDGTYVVVGADTEDPGTVSGAGSAYVFEMDEGGAGMWGQVAKLEADDGAVADSLGFSVSKSGNITVAGAPGANAVYLFGQNVGGTDAWGQFRKIVSGSSDGFGRSVSLAGDFLLVGAPAASSRGSAVIFGRNEGGLNAWGEIVSLSAPDSVLGENFGWSVAIDGNVALVGAYGQGAADSGAAYLFERNSGGSDLWGNVARLNASDAEADDRFGEAVALSGEGLVIGARYEDEDGADAGAGYIFTACGSGLTGVGEECDDGNTASGDGCDASCIVEFCGDGLNNNGGGEECDDGNVEDADGCDSNCVLEFCGNSVVQYDETCDDGNTGSGDGCDENCKQEVCGNAAVQDGEECDDGNTDSGDGCDAACTLEFCGDGLVNNVDEDCDEETFCNPDCTNPFLTRARVTGSSVVLGISAVFMVALLFARQQKRLSQVPSLSALVALQQGGEMKNQGSSSLSASDSKLTIGGTAYFKVALSLIDLTTDIAFFVSVLSVGQAVDLGPFRVIDLLAVFLLTPLAVAAFFVWPQVSSFANSVLTASRAVASRGLDFVLAGAWIWISAFSEWRKYVAGVWTEQSRPLREDCGPAGFMVPLLKVLPALILYALFLVIASVTGAVVCLWTLSAGLVGAAAGAVVVVLVLGFGGLVAVLTFHTKAFILVSSNPVHTLTTLARAHSVETLAESVPQLVLQVVMVLGLGATSAFFWISAVSSGLMILDTLQRVVYYRSFQTFYLKERYRELKLDDGGAEDKAKMAKNEMAEVEEPVVVVVAKVKS